MNPLLPSDNIRDRIKEALDIVEYLKPTTCPNTMSQEDYDKVKLLLEYIKRFFSISSKPLCLECRVYYGVSTGYRCQECKIGAQTYFSKLRKDDFNYPLIYNHYKGKLFRHLLKPETEIEEIETPQDKVSNETTIKKEKPIKIESPKEKFLKYLENKK